MPRSRRNRRVALLGGTLAIALTSAGLVATAGPGIGSTPGALRLSTSTPATAPVASTETRGAAKPSTHPLGRAKGLRFVVAARPTSGVATASPSSTGAPAMRSTGPAIVCIAGCPITDVAGPLTRVFNRLAGDVTLRVFTMNEPDFEPMGVAVAKSATSAAGTPKPVGSSTRAAPRAGAGVSSGVRVTAGATGATALAPYCFARSEMVVEASNPGAIGVVWVPRFATSATGISIGAFDAIDSAVVGTAEGAPIEVLVAQLALSAASVRVTFADGSTDSMTINDGIVVFASDATNPLPATLQAFDASGTLLGSASVSSDAAFAGPSPCVGPVPPVASPLPAVRSGAVPVAGSRPGATRTATGAPTVSSHASLLDRRPLRS